MDAASENTVNALGSAPKTSTKKLNPRLAWFDCSSETKTQEKPMRHSSVFVRSSNFIAVLLLALFSVVSSDELVFVVGETGSLQVTPSIEVIGKSAVSERLHIHGLERLKHINKCAHSLKLILSTNTRNISRKSIEICFHRNSSLAIGMCPLSQWDKVSNGSWVGIMSPFDHKILDITASGDSSKLTLELSAEQDFFMYRIVFLIMGIVLLSLASTLSKSVAFYYIGAVSIGVIILVTLVINQVMKRLPTGRFKSFLYSSVIGVGGYYFLQYLYGLVLHVLMEIGISEDLYLPLAVLAGGFVFLLGAWSGFWTVKKFVVTKDGSVDIRTSIFVSWSIRVFAVALILQSSLDPLLAGGALIPGILISSILSTIRRKLLSPREQDDETQNLANKFSSPPPRGRNKISRTIPLCDSDTFPSSFHKIPQGTRKLTKQELEKLTKETTEKALQKLISSPGFGEWAVRNAGRISVNPVKESSSRFTGSVKRRRWFHWFCKANSQ